MFRTIQIMTVAARDLPRVEREIRGTGRGMPVIKIDGRWREVFDTFDDTTYEQFVEGFPYHKDLIERRFENAADSALIGVRYFVDEKSNAGEWEDPIAFLRSVDLVEVQWPTEPNGEPPAKYKLVHEGTAMVITFNGEAWEYMYQQLGEMANDHIAVNLNGRDMKLVGVEGDIFDGTDAVLVVKPWMGAEQDYVGAEESIRLFHDDGQCAVTQLHVL